MQRIYTEVSRFRSPFIQGAPPFNGLGAWPQGRSYHDTSRWLSPYISGYFQDNNLAGFGTTLTDVATAAAAAAAAAAQPPFYKQPAVLFTGAAALVVGFILGKVT